MINLLERVYLLSCVILPAAPTKSLHSPKVTSGSFSPRRKSFRQPHTTWMSSMWDYNVNMSHAFILHSDQISLLQITHMHSTRPREILWNKFYNYKLLKHVIIQFYCITKHILKLKPLTKFGTPFPFINSFFNSLTCESALEKENKYIKWSMNSLFEKR